MEGRSTSGWAWQEAACGGSAPGRRGQPKLTFFFANHRVSTTCYGDGKRLGEPLYRSDCGRPGGRHRASAAGSARGQVEVSNRPLGTTSRPSWRRHAGRPGGREVCTGSTCRWTDDGRQDRRGKADDRRGFRVTQAFRSKLPNTRLLRREASRDFGWRPRSRAPFSVVTCLAAMLLPASLLVAPGPGPGSEARAVIKMFDATTRHSTFGPVARGAEGRSTGSKSRTSTSKTSTSPACAPRATARRRRSSSPT